MPLYLLDTDHMTALFRNGVEGKRVEARLKTIAPDDYGTTIISFEEQVRGWLDALNRLKKEGGLMNAYRELEGMRQMYGRFAVWQFNYQADHVHQSMIKANVKTGTQDMLIAAIALANNAVVLTRNRKDFAKVPGLAIEDWTA